MEKDIEDVLEAVNQWNTLEETLEEVAPSLLECDWKVNVGISCHRFHTNLPPGYCYRVTFKRTDEQWVGCFRRPGRGTANSKVKEKPLPEIVRDIHQTVAEEASTPRCERSDILKTIVEDAGM